mmetsp:Transcript_25744/g.47043  ORF Transcript_25744/g.47043 Transcript_25744/m.47043 type:complete len:246 (-) Transcript_25744:38-775(-)
MQCLSGPASPFVGRMEFPRPRPSIWASKDPKDVAMLGRVYSPNIFAWQGDGAGVQDDQSSLQMRIASRLLAREQLLKGRSTAELRERLCEDLWSADTIVGSKMAQAEDYPLSFAREAWLPPRQASFPACTSQAHDEVRAWVPQSASAPPARLQSPQPQKPLSRMRSRSLASCGPLGDHRAYSAARAEGMLPRRPIASMAVPSAVPAYSNASYDSHLEAMQRIYPRGYAAPLGYQPDNSSYYVFGL